MTSNLTNDLSDPSSPQTANHSHRTTAFLAGIVGGMIMTLMMLLLLLFGITGRSIANLVADKVAAVAGPGISEFFIHAIGPLGKELLFLSVLLGQVVVGGLLGLLFALIKGKRDTNRVIWRNAFSLSTGFWLFFVLFGFPLLDLGWFGVELGNERVKTLLFSLLLFELFGYILGISYIYLNDLARQEKAEFPQTKPGPSPQTSRRRFIGIMSAGFVLVVGTAIGLKAFGRSTATYWLNLGQPQPDGSLEGEVTAVEDFYLVSKNAFNPKVDGAGWKLSIDGLVTQSLSFDLESLRKLPQKTIYHTLTCISNQVGDRYIGNAQWSGIPLKTLLGQAGIKPGAQRVIFSCADGYTDSISLDKALETDTFLALQMNGQPLTTDHGFPVRVLVPNIYGMKNAKWLTSIKVVDSNFLGYWQKQGWNNEAIIHSESLITSPTDGGVVKAGQLTTLRGMAYAGSRRIEKVQVSVDGGQNWQEAQLKERLGPNTWTLWRIEWIFKSGGYHLMVRAVEEGNVTQTGTKADPFPIGSTGYHTIRIQSS